MRRLLRLVLCLYPAAWRQRYGDEFEALLEQAELRASDVLDVFIGGLTMRGLGMPRWLVAGALSVVGGVVALAITAATSQRVESSGTLEFRTLSSELASAPDSPALLTIASQALTDDFLRSLPASGSGSTPREVTPGLLRKDIEVSLLTPTTLKVSYASDEGRGVQEVTGHLLRRFVDVGFEAHLAGSMPRGTLWVIDDAAAPRARVSAQRMTRSVALGAGAGLMFAALWFRRPRLHIR